MHDTMREITKTARSSRGFMTADVLIALAVVAILTTVLTVAMTSHARASNHLAGARAAMRLADATLLALQAGHAPPGAPVGLIVHVDRATGGADLPAGCAWATVRITGGGHLTELTGIVRADAIKGATP